MLYRCRQLELINEGYYKKLRIYFSSRGWNKREPLDGELEMEQPRLLNDAIRVCLDSQVTTPQALLSFLHAPVPELEELANVVRGTLAPPSNVVKLKRDFS
jgi:hypothetical protein